MKNAGAWAEEIVIRLSYGGEGSDVCIESGGDVLPVRNQSISA